MTDTDTMASRTLARSLGPFQYFVLAFGSIVGSAWVVLLGDWYALAPPGAAAIGFFAGATVMGAIAACYAEMTARLPVAGGEMIYAVEVFGRFGGFLVGWFLALFLIGIVCFEGIAIGLLAVDLLPAISGPPLYASFGQSVAAGPLLLGIGGALAIGVINMRGALAAARVQAFCTVGFLILAAIAMAMGALRGSSANLDPLFGPARGGSWGGGAAWIFATCPLWLNGFQAAIQAIEERRPGLSIAAVGRVMVAAVIVAALFYITLVLTIGMAVPWQQLAGKPMATTIAMDHLDVSGFLRVMVIVGALAALVKTWNGVALTAARVVMAQARLGFLPQRLALIHPRFASPHLAVAAVTLVTLFGIAAGPGAILPILSTASISANVLLIMTAVELIVLRRRQRGAAPRYVAPFGWFTPVFAAAGTSAMAGYAILSPWLAHRDRVPVEWILLSAWLTLGIGAWYLRRSHGAIP